MLKQTNKTRTLRRLIPESPAVVRAARQQRFGAIALATISILLSITTIALGIYALFTDEAKVTNHLQAGTLDAELHRTALSKKYLDNTTGRLVTATNDNDVNFTDETTDNVFGIADGELLVPTSEYAATLQVKNNGTIAFDYKLLLSLPQGIAENKLAQQLQITVSGLNDTDIVKKLSELEVNADNEVVIGTGSLLKDGTRSFTVTLKFVDQASNNDAQGAELSFDLIVRATQATAE